jgi:hypothetical protein
MFSPAAPLARPVYAQQPVASPRSPAPQAMELPYALIAEIVDAGGERVYGAVDAPGWVAPIGGIAVIGTALLPVLLAPGEQAFTRQQGDEQKVKAQFGKGRGVFRRGKK